MGCPIRRSRDHRALAPPPSFSQRATSFIASRCQGIHQMPFSCSPTPSPKTALARASGPASVRPYRDHAPRRICIPMPGHDRSTARVPPKPNPKVAPGRSRRPLLSCPLHGHDSLHDVKTSRGPRRPLRATRADSCPGDSAGWQSHPRSHPRLLVGLGRFERPTSRLSGVRSDQLSYRPPKATGPWPHAQARPAGRARRGVL